MKPDFPITDQAAETLPLARHKGQFRLRDLYLSPSLMLSALVSLLKARLALGRLSGLDVVSLNSEFEATQNAVGDAAALEDLARERVAVAVPYIARFVPWRSDCVVQALAARNMLKSKGIVSEIRVGARPLPDSRVDAHAWLVSGGLVITGGQSSTYPVLVGARRGAAENNGAAPPNGS